MKLEDLKKIPRFANCADEEAAIAAVSETAARAERADELERQNEELQRQLDEQQTERIEQAVTDAVTDGRIDAGQADTYRNLLKNELDTEPKGDKTGAWEKRQAEIRNKYQKQ